MEDERYPVHAPGWAAIDRVLGLHFGDRVPHQFTSASAYDLEGRSPLPAIGVWEGEGPAHWLYVSYGLSELFEKSSPQADVSGFGFELTLRLPRAEGEPRPPGWALTLLQGIGHYVLSGHGVLDSGHVIDLGGPIVPPDDARPSTALTAVMCVPDPLLGKIATPHGSLLFLALWGLTAQEAETVGAWDLARKIGLATEVSPAVLTDPGRGPLSADPQLAPVWRRYALNVLV